MAKPIVVTIPHQLGKQEASRRLKHGLERLRGGFADLKLSAIEEKWSGDHLDFRWGIMGQSASGTIDVEADHVRLEVQLPWLLARVAERAKALFQREGKLLLEKK